MMTNLLLAVAILIGLGSSAEAATGTCDQKTDGSTGGAVTDDDCGAGFSATIDSTRQCAGSGSCDPSPGGNDHGLCCTAAIGTCAQKTDGSTGGAVTDDDCGAGFSAIIPSPTGPCSGYTTACDPSPGGPDNGACCTANSGTCAQKIDGSTGGAVTDDDCGAGFSATIGATGGCTDGACDLSPGGPDHNGCCTANACKLPVGTESAGTACDNGEGGCAISVLQAATELSCTSGYNGSPAKANAVCGSNGVAFTLSTGDFCAGNGGGSATPTAAAGAATATLLLVLFAKI